jgi:hypothetical protein
MVAVMAVWGDIAPGAEDAFNEWYLREHVAERVALPGFRNGRRYVRTGRGRHRYLAMYEVDDIGVFTSTDYLARLDDPTGLTQRMMPHFRNFVRTVFHTRLRLGEAAGGVVTSIRFEPRADSDAGIVQWLTTEALIGLADAAGICRVQLLEADAERSTVGSRERTMRRGPDGFAPWTVLIEATDVDALRRAMGTRFDLGTFRERGALKVQVGVYRLMFAFG